MNSEVVDIDFDGNRVAGVLLRDGAKISAKLVLAADGRGSVLRAAAALPLKDLGSPIDVFWFRVPKLRTPENRTQVYVGGGQMIVTIDRGDYFQCARVIAKGSAAPIRVEGFDQFRTEVARIAPVLEGNIGELHSFDDVKLLSVSLDRLTRWHRPGLLAIGDAAHAMSPVGGVGINLAIQDAVAAGNILARPMARGVPIDPLLPKVQYRRILPVRVIQALQRQVHERLIGPALRHQSPKPNALVKLISATPLLQRIPARLIGLGIRREHIRSPRA